VTRCLELEGSCYKQLTNCGCRLQLARAVVHSLIDVIGAGLSNVSSRVRSMRGSGRRPQRSSLGIRSKDGAEEHLQSPTLNQYVSLAQKIGNCTVAYPAEVVVLTLSGAGKLASAKPPPHTAQSQNKESRYALLEPVSKSAGKQAVPAARELHVDVASRSTLYDRTSSSSHWQASSLNEKAFAYIGNGAIPTTLCRRL
jgi:hypothetical protein